MISQIHREIRDIAHNLTPLTLEKDGLIDAVREFVHQLNNLNILEFKVIDNTLQALNFSKDIQLVLYRIIQECLNNIMKHAQAQQASILFSISDPTQLMIQIEDDGMGFEDIQEHQGLTTVRSRIATIQGKINIDSQPLKGTHITIVVPTTIKTQ